MTTIVLYCLLAAVAALVVGVVVGRQLAGKARHDHEGAAQAAAQKLLREAEAEGSRLRDEKIQQADERLEQSKNKFKNQRDEFEKESRRQKQALEQDLVRQKQALEQELVARRQGVTEQEQSIKLLTDTTQRQLEQLQRKETDLEKAREKS